MKSYVADTSVAVAWYLPEVFSDTARVWQSRLLDGRVRFVVPGLHYWEFANVLRTYVRRGELDESLSREIWRLHLDAPLDVVEPGVDRVLPLALEYQMTAYDAVYVALALELDLPLLTAERSSTPWVKKLGNRVLTVAG
ncbi:MAG: type II toxin-antitoxin system VapC family toxin [Acidobacteriota bacterium]